MEKNEQLFTFHNVSYAYEAGKGAVLHDINLVVRQGEWLWITGASQAGKSTLCHLFNASLQSDGSGVWQGEQYFAGRRMDDLTPLELAGSISVVGQEAAVSFIQDIVEDELAFAPENLCYTVAQIEQRIEEALSVIDMSAARLRRISTLSGGQMQRIALASVLTLKPKVLVLDNALASQDRGAVKKIMSTLRLLQQQGYTIIIASTRLDEALPEERVMMLEDGKIIADKAMGELPIDWLVQKGCMPSYEKPQNRVKRNDKVSELNRKPLLQLEQLSFDYEHKDGAKHERLLSDLNLTICPGDIMAVQGANGRGKTTLGKLIAGILTPYGGTMWHRGHDLAAYSDAQRAQAVSYAFQNPQHMFVTDTVFDEIIFAMSDDKQRAVQEGEYWLERVGLMAYRNQHPMTLHLVEQQLLCLAVLLSSQPNLLIVDEPTAGLCYVSTDRIMAHYADFAAEGGAVMIITHDDYVIEQWTNKQFRL